MQEGDYEKLQSLLTNQVNIGDAKMAFLRTVNGFKAKIDELQARVGQNNQISVDFYENNRDLLRVIQKHIQILTKVSELLRSQNHANFDPLKRQLLTNYNRQAHRFNMLIPQKIKARMKQSKFLSKLKFQEEEDQEINDPKKQEKDEDERFSEVIQSLSFYLISQISQDNEQKTEPIIGEKQFFEHRSEGETEKESVKQEPSEVEKRQSLKKFKQQTEANLSQEQKQARNAYKWFLFRQNVNIGMRYVCMCLCLVLLILMGIVYVIVRQIREHFEDL